MQFCPRAAGGAPVRGKPQLVHGPFERRVGVRCVFLGTQPGNIIMAEIPIAQAYVGLPQTALAKRYESVNSGVATIAKRDCIVVTTNTVPTMMPTVRRKIAYEAICHYRNSVLKLH